jgi:long-chain acyl-CoA synthetase
MLGIYSKNREEWVLTDIANLKTSVVTVGFYDTLGPTAVEYILKQTLLTTVACSSDYLPSFIKLKKEGKAVALENIISFDAIDE